MLNNSELLEQLSAGSKEAESMLVQNNMGLVYSIVSRLDCRLYDREDLVQIGALGLIKAVKKFDTSFNVQFSTYAVPMILGEIKRFLRDDGAIKVSRSIKETALKGKRCREALEKKLGRTPAISEIAKESGISENELIEAFEASAPPESLQAAVIDGDDRLSLMGLVADDGNEEKIVDKLVIKQSLLNLTDRERTIIILRYFKGKTQTDISEHIGVSQVQVSRIEKKALLKMRSVIEDNNN